MKTLTPSRRNVMRALAAITTGLPTLAYATPGLICLPAGDAAWSAAVAVEQEARDASERFYAVHVQPAVDAHDKGTGSFDFVVEQEGAWSEYTGRHAGAIDALIMTPAPTLDGVARKLRLGISEWAFDGSSASLALLEAVAADLDRLSGRA